MAGALEHILDQSVQWSLDRVQFGRPIAKFQAVQHNLATLAGEVAAAGAAADAAAEAIAGHGDRTAAEVAIAKLRVGEAAGAGAAIAHQVHGAMGFTYEHRCTRDAPAVGWREEFGNETHMGVQLGHMVAAQGADALWPFVTRGREASSMAYDFHFDPVELPPECEALREEVRDFLRREIESGSFAPEPARAPFSARLRPQGRRQGLDRHDLAEAIWRPRAHASRTLRRDRGDAGAPRPDPLLLDRRPAVGAVILRYGQPEIREKILPRIASGELCFCIGLSEPNSGSDVFAASTRATKTDGGWLVNGRKIWTSNAHQFRLHDRAVAHLDKNQGKPSPRPDPVPDRLPINRRASRSGRSST